MEGVSLKALKGSSIKLAKVELGAGTVIDAHDHPVEVLLMVVSGKIDVGIAKTRKIMLGGELAIIHPNVSHDAVAIEDTVLIEAYAND